MKDDPTAQDVTEVVAELLRVSEDVLQAIAAHDAHSLSHHLAADFVLLSGPSRVDRHSFLEGVRNATFETVSATFDSIEVEVLGESGVVAGVQRVEVLLDGVQAVSRAAFTDVFVYQEGRWLLRVASSAELA